MSPYSPPRGSRIENCCTAFNTPNEMPMLSTSSSGVCAGGDVSGIRASSRRIACCPSPTNEPARQVIPQLVDAKQSLRPHEHHDDQQQRVDDQPILIDVSQRFGQDRQK